MEELNEELKVTVVNADEYYQIGSSDYPVISNSALSAINPHEGGSFDKFVAFLDGKYEKKSRYMELGSLIHKYIESPTDFSVSPLDKPEPMLCELTELVYDTLKEKKIQLNTALSNREKLLGLYIRIKNEKNLYKNIKKENTIKEYTEKSIDYLSYLYSSDGKIILTPQQKETISKIQVNLNNSSEINKIVFGTDAFGSDLRMGDVYSELGIMWEYDGIIHKGLLDKVWIDIPNKIVNIIDTKTTSDSVYNFMGKKVCVPYAAGENLNYPYNFKPRYELRGGAFQKYRVYRQLAVYVEAIRNYLQSLGLPAQDFRINCYVLVIQTTGDCPCLLYEINPEWIFFGKDEYRELFNLAKTHIKKLTTLWNN